jgi:hypothetical protein
MEKIVASIDQCINSMIELHNVWKSTDWDEYSEEFFEKLTENYPFKKDLNELIIDLIEWREKLNK